MKHVTLHRIRYESHAPRLRFAPEVLADLPEAGVFDGRVKCSGAAKSPWRVLEDGLVASDSFCHLADGAIVIEDETLSSNDDLYYCLSTGAEWFGVKSSQRYFGVINPVFVMPAGKGVENPCTWKDWISVFRIAGRDLRELYCTTGFAPDQRDEFKNVYERHHLKGLVFEQIWAGSVGVGE